MNNLAKLARGLKQLAVEKSENQKLSPEERKVRHTLKHGLKIVVLYREGEWNLGFWRKDSIPSEMEIDICKRDFAIPEGAICSGEKFVRDEQRAAWRGFVFSWHGSKELEAQPELAAAATD